jgi:hypothetical protein
MKQIWKYMLYPDCEIEMPFGSKLLDVQTQHETPCVWVLVDPNPEIVGELRRFRIFGTGHTLSEPTGKYVGTFQLNRGTLVLHVFETKGE